MIINAEVIFVQLETIVQCVCVPVCSRGSCHCSLVTSDVLTCNCNEQDCVNNCVGVYVYWWISLKPTTNDYTFTRVNNAMGYRIL